MSKATTLPKTLCADLVCEATLAQARYTLFRLNLGALCRYFLVIEDSDCELTVLDGDQAESERLFRLAVEGELSAVHLSDWAEDLRHTRKLLFR